MIALTCAVLAATPLQLEDVLTSAQQHFPTLIAAQADLEGAEGELLQASGAFDPVWRTRGTGLPVSGYPQVRVDSAVEVATPLWGSSLFAGWRLGTGKIQSYYGERETWSAGELRAGASIPILRNGPTDRRRTTQARAELGRDAAARSLEQQQFEIVRAATNRYWEWVAAGHRHRVAVALLELARTRDAQFEARLSAGDAAHFDRQDNRRALLQREAVATQLRRALEQAALELSLYVRDASGQPRHVTADQLPDLPAVTSPAEVQLDEVLERRPDLQRWKAQKTSAELERRLQQNQLLPALDLGVAVSKDLGTSPRADADALGPTELELNVTFELPLLWRAPRGRIQAASAAVARIDAQLQLARERVRVELDDARSALRLAQERLTLTSAEVATSELVEGLERQRLSLGEGSLLFVNLREQATAEARLRQIDALLDGQRALAAWQQATATWPSTK